MVEKLKEYKEAVEWPKKIVEPFDHGNNLSDAVDGAKKELGVGSVDKQPKYDSLWCRSCQSNVSVKDTSKGHVGNRNSKGSSFEPPH